MKTLKAALVALTLASGVAQARPIDGYFTDLNQTAPLSASGGIQDSAPKSLFDEIGQSAPRAAGEGTGLPLDLTGE